MKFEDYNDLMNRLNKRTNRAYAAPETPDLFLSEEAMQSIRDSVSQPVVVETGGLDYLESIDENTAGILEAISTERQSRILGDEENMAYTKKQDKRNWKLAVLAAITGTIGAAAGIASLIISLAQ